MKDLELSPIPQKGQSKLRSARVNLGRGTGFEPATSRSTGARSATELPSPCCLAFLQYGNLQKSGRHPVYASVILTRRPASSHRDGLDQPAKWAFIRDLRSLREKVSCSPETIFFRETLPVSISSGPIIKTSGISLRSAYLSCR